MIDRAPDTSERALKRSPAWLKCLLPREDLVRQYDQVAWVDADIRIRPSAPSLFDDVPEDVVAAVDEYSTPSKEDYAWMLDRLYRRWDETGIQYIKSRTAQEYHANFGLKNNLESVVQTGVMVFSPRLHGDIFAHTYETYEDKGSPAWNYEMRPLSYELQMAAPIKWISPRFNTLWGHHIEIFYPFLNDRRSTAERVLRRLGYDIRKQLTKRCVECAFQNSYFLHFVASSGDFKFLSPTAA